MCPMQPKLTVQGMYCDIEECICTSIRRFLPSKYSFKIDRRPSEEPIEKDLTSLWQVEFECDDVSNASISGSTLEGNAELLQLLVYCSLSNFVSEQQLASTQSIAESYAIQVTNDFEELVWLRSLAEQFTHCDVRNSMKDVALQLLPSLRVVLNADCLHYVNQDFQGLSPSADDWLSAGQVHSAIDVNDLIQLATNNQTDSLYIYNSTNSIQLRDKFPNLHSCLICRLGVGTDYFGWLVAVRYPIKGQDIEHSEIDEREFGTFEAGLIQSAATLFQTHGRNIDLVQQKEGLLVGAVRSLINSIDAKDPYTFGHSDRVAGMSKRIAIELGFDSKTCEQIYMTGLLHDIGKIGIPDSVLSKPSRLTDEEFEIIKQHPVIGYKILKHLDSLSYTFSGVLHHHESYDGKGYPDKLAGEAIPLNGRILAVADSFDAMTSSRPYRHAMSFERAESIIRDGAGKQWDPTIVEAFFAAIDDIKSLCAGQPKEMQEDRTTPVVFESQNMPTESMAKL